MDHPHLHQLHLTLSPSFELHRHYSITQTPGSFSNHLLNDTVQRVVRHLLFLDCKVQSAWWSIIILFKDIVAPFCDRKGRNKILPEPCAFQHTFFSACNKEAGHETTDYRDGRPNVACTCTSTEDHRARLLYMRGNAFSGLQLVRC